MPHIAIHTLSLAVPFSSLFCFRSSDFVTSRSPSDLAQHSASDGAIDSASGAVVRFAITVVLACSVLPRRDLGEGRACTQRCGTEFGKPHAGLLCDVRPRCNSDLLSSRRARSIPNPACLACAVRSFWMLPVEPWCLLHTCVRLEAPVCKAAIAMRL